MAKLWEIIWDSARYDLTVHDYWLIYVFSPGIHEIVLDSNIRSHSPPLGKPC